MDSMIPGGDPDTVPDHAVDETEHPLSLGDVTDDDGQAIDLWSNAGNPNLVGFPFAVPEAVDTSLTASMRLTPTTRVVASRLVVTPGQPAMLALPADPDRRDLLITMTSLGSAAAGSASDPILWSNEQTIGADYNNAAYVYTSQPDRSCHTGPVWVAAPSTSVLGGSVTGAQCVVVVRAVTL